jgi:hypothetical protein
MSKAGKEYALDKIINVIVKKKLLVDHSLLGFVDEQIYFLYINFGRELLVLP